MLTVPRALDADLAAEQGMSLSDYSTLMHLSEAPDRTLRMSDLAAATALSLSGMSRIVARLEVDHVSPDTGQVCGPGASEPGEPCFSQVRIQAAAVTG
jgi:hypothetical protein